MPPLSISRRICAQTLAATFPLSSARADGIKPEACLMTAFGTESGRTVNISFKTKCGRLAWEEFPKLFELIFDAWLPASEYKQKYGFRWN